METGAELNVSPLSLLAQGIFRVSEAQGSSILAVCSRPFFLLSLGCDLLPQR